MRLQAAAAILITICAPVTVRASDRQEITALYEKLRQAMLHKDAAAITRLETPDFKTIERGRSMDGAQTEAGLRQQFAMEGDVHYMRIKIASLKVQGKSAIAVSTFKYAGEMKGPSARRPHIMTMDGEVHNALKKTSEGWRFQSMKSGPMKVTMDGKVMSTPAGGRPQR